MMDAPSVDFSGTQARLMHAHQMLGDMDRVVFDWVTKTSEAIRYDTATGIFELLTPATYLVNWDVAVDGSFSAPFVKFAVEAGGEIYGPSVLPTNMGALSGASLVTVLETPAALSLVNYTKDIVRLSAVPPTANITITKVSGTDASSEQAFNELIYSIALEEIALAHILYAEGEKIRAAIKMEGITVEELLRLNCSVESTIESIARLEAALSAKLKKALTHGKGC
jgi:hypothetical protein